MKAIENQKTERWRKDRAMERVFTLSGYNVGTCEISWGKHFVQLYISIKASKMILLRQHKAIHRNH
jgi:hypothetical protein